MRDYKYTLSILIAAALAVVIGLLTSCTMVTNYYIVNPTKVERVECDHRPISFEWGDNIQLTPWEVEPGFYEAPWNVPSFDDQTIDLRGWQPAIDSAYSHPLITWTDTTWLIRFDNQIDTTK